MTFKIKAVYNTTLAILNYHKKHCFCETVLKILTWVGNNGDLLLSSNPVREAPLIQEAATPTARERTISF